MQSGRFFELPAEIKYRIFSFLSANDMHAYLLSHKSALDDSKDDYFWRQRVAVDYGIKVPHNMLASTFYRELVRQLKEECLVVEANHWSVDYFKSKIDELQCAVEKIHLEILSDYVAQVLASGYKTEYIEKTNELIKRHPCVDYENELELETIDRAAALSAFSPSVNLIQYLFQFDSPLKAIRKLLHSYIACDASLLFRRFVNRMTSSQFNDYFSAYRAATFSEALQSGNRDIITLLCELNSGCDLVVDRKKSIRPLHLLIFRLERTLAMPDATRAELLVHRLTSSAQTLVNIGSDLDVVIESGYYRPHLSARDYAREVHDALPSNSRTQPVMDALAILIDTPALCHRPR